MFRGGHVCGLRIGQRCGCVTPAPHPSRHAACQQAMNSQIIGRFQHISRGFINDYIAPAGAEPDRCRVCRYEPGDCCTSRYRRPQAADQSVRAPFARRGAFVPATTAEPRRPACVTSGHVSGWRAHNSCMAVCPPACRRDRNPRRRFADDPLPNSSCAQVVIHRFRLIRAAQQAGI